MILAMIKIFAPNYYRRVWNAEFKKQMEVYRLELRQMYPGHEGIVDSTIDKAILENLK